MKDHLSLGEIAALFGLTRSTVQRLAIEGLFTRSRAGHFDVAKSARKYVGHLREVARNRSESAAARATIRLKESVARLNEIKEKRLSGELIPMAETRNLISQFARAWRASFLSVPRRIRVALRLTVAQADEIEKVVDDTLSELAE